MEHLWHTALQQLPLSYLDWIIPRQIENYSCTMKQTNVDGAHLLIFMIIYKQTIGVYVTYINSIWEQT